MGETWNRDRPDPKDDVTARERDGGVTEGTEPEPFTEDGQARFEDPGCPAIEQSEVSIECDPLLGDAECGAGYACTPFVDYPSSPCEPEHFGTTCRLAGPGLQGDSCVEADCAPGFLCVASGQGTVCAELCVSPGPNTCPVGFLCGTVDVKGYGVCF